MVETFRQRRAQRDAEIRRLYAAGMTGSALALQFTLSKQRISQIVLGQKRQRGRRVNADGKRACAWCGKSFTVSQEHHHYCCQEHMKRAYEPLYSREEFEAELAAKASQGREP